LSDIWTSLISVDRLDQQVVVYVQQLGFKVKLFVLVREVRDVWEWLNCMHACEGGAVM